MSQQLKPLLLPILAQERRRRESVMDNEPDYFSQTILPTQMYSISDISAPVTPTFSAQTYLGCPSSASSLESTFTSPSIGSPSSYMGTKTSKASLPDVQEELYEREDSPDQLQGDDDDVSDYNYCFYDQNSYLYQDPVILRNSMLSPSCVRLESNVDVDYDLTDGFFCGGDYYESNKVKNRGTGETPLTGFATRLGTRFPLFTRRWKIKSSDNPVSIIRDRKGSGARRRRSSTSNSAHQKPELQSSPMSTPSSIDERDDWMSLSKLDANKANQHDLNREEAACTPLLPPLMTDASANKRKASLQSPLQSPSVAEVNEPLARRLVPLGLSASPPQLSSQPSTASFSIPRSNYFLSPSELPPITIADPDDEWANKLGHANFTIFPEPYLPSSFDVLSCQQLRADWDLARSNYMKHLVRTGEHYGLTSKTYRLTEEKWKTIDKTWRLNNELALSQMGRNDCIGSQPSRQSPTEHGCMAKFPSLSDLRNGNKSPLLSDENIVGPMVQATTTLHRNPTKKARVIKFLSEKLSFPK